MSATRVIVGAVLGDEIVPMLNAMNSGAAGSMCTLRANSSAEAFNKLALLAAQAPERLEFRQAFALANEKLGVTLARTSRVSAEEPLSSSSTCAVLPALTDTGRGSSKAEITGWPFCTARLT